jgi:hypothetical protein
MGGACPWWRKSCGAATKFSCAARAFGAADAVRISRGTNSQQIETAGAVLPPGKPSPSRSRPRSARHGGNSPDAAGCAREHTMSLHLPALSPWAGPPESGDRTPSALAGRTGSRQRTLLSLAVEDRTACLAPIRLADAAGQLFFKLVRPFVAKKSPKGIRRASAPTKRRFHRKNVTPPEPAVAMARPELPIVVRRGTPAVFKHKRQFLTMGASAGADLRIPHSVRTSP